MRYKTEMNARNWRLRAARPREGQGQGVHTSYVTSRGWTEEGGIGTNIAGIYKTYDARTDHGCKAAVRQFREFSVQGCRKIAERIVQHQTPYRGSVYRKRAS